VIARRDAAAAPKPLPALANRAIMTTE
jgi:hypothetical protein